MSLQHYTQWVQRLYNKRIQNYNPIYQLPQLPSYRQWSFKPGRCKWQSLYPLNLVVNPFLTISCKNYSRKAARELPWHILFLRTARPEVNLTLCCGQTAGKYCKDEWAMAKSQCGRLSAAYLARSHIRQLKLILVNAPSEAAVKLFHSTTECALEGKVTA